jgi:hypothetical protein
MSNAFPSLVGGNPADSPVTDGDRPVVRGPLRPGRFALNVWDGPSDPDFAGFTDDTKDEYGNPRVFYTREQADALCNWLVGPDYGANVHFNETFDFYMVALDPDIEGSESIYPPTTFGGTKYYAVLSDCAWEEREAPHA